MFLGETEGRGRGGSQFQVRGCGVDYFGAARVVSVFPRGIVLVSLERKPFQIGWGEGGVFAISFHVRRRRGVVSPWGASRPRCCAVSLCNRFGYESCYGSHPPTFLSTISLVLKNHLPAVSPENTVPLPTPTPLFDSPFANKTILYVCEDTFFICILPRVERP